MHILWQNFTFLEIADFVFVELNGQTCVQSSFDHISDFVATELSKSPKYQNMQRPNLPYYIIGILSVVREAFWFLNPFKSFP